MPRDPRPYITVDQGMPLHDKVRPLSDKAFRLIIEAWCWSKRNRKNGRIALEDWHEMQTAKARSELVRRGLVHEVRGGVQLHDYLDHQLSAAEETGLTAKRTRASIAGNHKRWHLDLGVIEPTCELCPSTEEPPEDIPDDSHMGSHLGSREGSHLPPNVSTTSGSSRETSGGVSPTATRANERPPRNCPAHPNGTDEPCGPCKDARIAWETWKPAPKLVLRCDEHHTNHHGTCPGCRADEIAGMSA